MKILSSADLVKSVINQTLKWSESCLSEVYQKGKMKGKFQKIA